jgi:hypothetical protein
MCPHTRPQSANAFLLLVGEESLVDNKEGVSVRVRERSFASAGTDTSNLRIVRRSQDCLMTGHGRGEHIDEIERMLEKREIVWVQTRGRRHTLPMILILTVPGLAEKNDATCGEVPKNGLS